MAIKCEEINSSSEGTIVIVETPPEGKTGTSGIFNRSQLISLGILMIVVLIICTTVCITILLPRQESVTSHYSDNTNDLEGESPRKNFIDSDVSPTLPGDLKFVSRREWLAEPSTEKLIPLNLPVPYVIISHTATEDCLDLTSCSLHVRFIQTFHIESHNWSDIGYNFLVGGDGNAYEGRGFNNRGAHTYGYNTRAIGIAFIGNFNEILPPERQIVAAQKLIEKGVKENYIASNYKLLGAIQVQPTQSPGLKLYENMKTWPHWAKFP